MRNKLLINVIMIFIISLFFNSSPLAQKIYKIPFLWYGEEINNIQFDKAAMLVPVKVPGHKKTYYTQFDTGANYSIFYKKILLQHGLINSQDTSTFFEYTWLDNTHSNAILESDMDWLVDTLSQEPVQKVIGSIGCEQLAGKITEIDFVNQLIIIYTDTNIFLTNLKSQIDYMPLRYNERRIFLDISLGKDTLKDVFYDSGSSIATLILPKIKWEQITGKTNSDTGVTILPIISWGDTLYSYLANVSNELKIGSITLGKPEVEYVDWSNGDDFVLIGNAPFYDKYSIVLDCIRNQFGVYLPEKK